MARCLAARTSSFSAEPHLPEEFTPSCSNCPQATAPSLRVSVASTGKLLATFFGLTSGDWLTVTPQGFSAGTLGGKDNISAVRGLEVTAVDETLFNPDRVREALSGDPGGDL